MSQPDRDLRIPIKIEPIDPTTHHQDGVEIDLGIQVYVDGHNQPFSLTSHFRVEKGARFHIEDKDGQILYISSSKEDSSPDNI